MSINNPLVSILCVDDNTLLLQGLASCFEASGFEVATAVNGIDALTKFQAHGGRFDAILSDREMPLMDGPALIKAVRSLDYHGMIFMMSGSVSAADNELCEKMKISGFFHKPFEVRKVANLLIQGTQLRLRSY